MAAGLSVDLERWQREFDELMLRVGAQFAWVGPRRRMTAFMQGGGSNIMSAALVRVAVLVAHIEEDCCVLGV